MEISPPTIVFGEGNFLEGIRWHEGRWWLSDHRGGQVRAITPSGDVEVITTVAGRPSGLGWLPDGDLIIASMRDRLVLRCSSDYEVSVHADLSGIVEDRINDMTVNSVGQAFVGSVGTKSGDRSLEVKAAPVIRVDPDGTFEIAASDLMCPNGMDFLDGGRTLVVAESFGGGLTAFTVDPSGSLSDRRSWAQIGHRPDPATVAEMHSQLQFAPDGLSAMGDGTVWVADVKSGRCFHLAPGGAILDEIQPPHGEMVFACAVGGEDGRTLALCVAPDWEEEKRLANRDSKLITYALGD